MSVSLLLVAGCSLDGVGLMGPPGSDGPDSSFVEAGDEGTPPLDAAPDDAPALDAPDDAPAAVDAGMDDGVADAAPEADAGPALTITGGNYDLLDEDGGVCSGNSGNTVNFQLQNDRDAAVDLIWVNYQCGEQKYGTVPAGGNRTQQTYINHVWRIRNTQDQAFIAQYRLTGNGAFTVTVH